MWEEGWLSRFQKLKKKKKKPPLQHFINYAAISYSSLRRTHHPSPRTAARYELRQQAIASPLPWTAVFCSAVNIVCTVGRDFGCESVA